MNNRNVGIIGGFRGFGLALLEILGAGGRLPQSVARPTRERVRVQAETRDDAGLMKAAGIKRLRRQQRNTLLAEKGAFLDSRRTYPLRVSGVRVFADGKEIVGFG